MKVLCPQQTLPLPCSAGITCGAGAAPLHRVPAPSPSQEGLGSSCHSKTAAGSLRDTQDSSHAGLELIGIPAPRERLLWVRSGTHWVQPELDSVCKLSDTVKALREEGTGFKGSERCQKQPELLFKGLGAACSSSWLWVPCSLRSRDNSLGKGAQPGSKPHHHNFQGPS